MKRLVILCIIGLLCDAARPIQADIFQWEYINPDNTGLGKQQSNLLCVDGLGLQAQPNLNAQGKNLTKAYLIAADLLGADASSANLTSADLSGALLYNSRLPNATLINANLSGATLTYAALDGANFDGAEVRGADFYLTNLTLAQLKTTASYAALDMTGINLSTIYLSGANFANQNLTNANLSFTNLSGADLSGAVVRGATFEGSGATLTQLYSTASYLTHDLTGIGMFGYDLSGVDFSDQNLSYADFRWATFTGANLSRANATNAGFRDAHLIGANLSEALLANASFYGNLSDANLSGADARGAIFTYCTLTNANLSEANAANASFNVATLIGTNLSQANLTNANFQFADLSAANLSGADARGVLFLDSIQTGTITNNLIRSNGHIAGLNLTAGALLVVRDYDGNPTGSPPVGPLPIVVEQHLAMDAISTLRLEFDVDSWDSTISFAPGISVARSGTLELTFATGMNLLSQVGRTFDLFDWSDVSPTGTFNVSSPYTWDLSSLYTTGEVTFIAAGPGDYNYNGTVNAADYVLWRDTPESFGGDPDGYATWRSNFGNPSVIGSAIGRGTGNVPEPSAIALLMLGSAAAGSLRERWTVYRE